MAIGSTLIGLVFALFFGSMSSLAHAGITAFGGIFDGGNNDPTDGTADGLHVGTAAAPGMLTVDGGSQLATRPRPAPHDQVRRVQAFPP